MSSDVRSSLRHMTSVQVLAGPGIVGRYGDVVVWMEEGTDGGGAVATALLALARALADEPDARPGARVAEVLRSDPGAVPAMVLVAPTPGGIQAIVHGWGRVLADGVDIDGGWADREIPWTTALAAGRGGDLLRVPTPGSILDLRRGSTPGGGAAVVLAGRVAAPPLLPQPEPPPPMAPQPEIPRPVSISSPLAAPPIQRTEPQPAQPATTAPAGFEAIDLRAAPARRDPLPIGGRGGAVSPASGTTVKGVVCSRGHFNNPIALFCGTCGISMGQVTRILQDGIRPSLGTLVLDDGTAFGLDTDHLVGSAPDAEAAGGTARPVTLVDAHNQIAPVHAEVRLVGWDVVLVARAPAFLLAHGAQQWTPVPPGQPTPLPAGARVALSQRTFVVESNARNSGV